jgi:hypothetical protein
VIAQYALPTHRQAAAKAAAQSVAVLPVALDLEPVRALQPAAETVAIPAPSIPVPIRC